MSVHSHQRNIKVKTYINNFLHLNAKLTTSRYNFNLIPLNFTTSSQFCLVCISPCNVEWSYRHGKAQQDAENSQISLTYHPSVLHFLVQTNTRGLVENYNGVPVRLQTAVYKCIKDTSSDVQTLHRQHPVIVPCIVKSVLHHCIVGKLLQDFHSFILSACLVKCCESVK